MLHKSQQSCSYHSAHILGEYEIEIQAKPRVYVTDLATGTLAWSRR